MHVKFEGLLEFYNVSSKEFQNLASSFRNLILNKKLSV